MLRLFKRLVTIALCAIYDFLCWIPNVINVHLLGQHERIVRDSHPAVDLKQAKRIAIVAIFPSADSLPFTCNLIDGLNANGFSVLVVSTKLLGDADRAVVLQRAARVIERLPVGRDFGSYRLGLKTLGFAEDAQDIACEQLVLANDSMYYRKDIDHLIADMLALCKPCLAMFENYEPHHHAQSFFLAFERPVFRSVAFRNFWRRYSPYSTRTHSINKGEVGLSTTLRSAGFAIAAYFNSTRIRSILEQVDFKDAKGDLLDLLPIRANSPFDMAFDGVRTLAVRDVSPSEAEFLRQMFWFRMVRHLCHLAETSNATHALGLLANRFASAPLKRDLCYRGTFDIAQVVASATGFGQTERAYLEADLRDRGFPGSMGLLQRMLYLNGRI